MIKETNKQTKARLGHSSASIAAYCTTKGTDLRESTVRALWRRGAPRTDAEFLQWYLANAEQRPRDTPDMKQLKEENLRRKNAILVLQEAALRREEDESARRLLTKAEVDEDVARVFARMKGMLSAAFVTELPARQAGRPADEIAAMNEERLGVILSELHAIGRGGE